MRYKLTPGSVFIIGIAFITIASLGLVSCEKSNTNANCKDKNLTCTADGSSFESCVITAANYTTYVWIQAQAEDGKSSIHLYIPKTTGTYILGDTSPYSAQYWKGPILSVTSYLTDSTHTGSVTITKYDAANKLMSGTFNFDCHQYMPVGSAQKSVTAGIFTDVKW